MQVKRILIEITPTEILKDSAKLRFRVRTERGNFAYDQEMRVDHFASFFEQIMFDATQALQKEIKETW